MEGSYGRAVADLNPNRAAPLSFSRPASGCAIWCWPNMGRRRRDLTEGLSVERYL
jgi:hypothetical protein